MTNPSIRKAFENVGLSEDDFLYELHRDTLFSSRRVDKNELE